MVELKKLDQLIQAVEAAKQGATRLRSSRGGTPTQDNTAEMLQARRGPDPVSAFAELFKTDPATAWAYLMGDRVGDIDLPSERKR